MYSQKVYLPDQPENMNRFGFFVDIERSSTVSQLFPFAGNVIDDIKSTSSDEQPFYKVHNNAFRIHMTEYSQKACMCVCQLKYHVDRYGADTLSAALK